MKFIVSYDHIACDDLVPETVSSSFTDFFRACDYFAECEETEDNVRISVVNEGEYLGDIPF